MQWNTVDHGNFKVKITCFQKNVLCFIYISPKQILSILWFVLVCIVPRWHQRKILMLFCSKRWFFIVRMIIALVIGNSFLFFSFQGCTHGIGGFPGQGSNQSYSRQPMPQPQQCWIQAASAAYTIVHETPDPQPTTDQGQGSKLSSWILVRFVSTEPQWELPKKAFLKIMRLCFISVLVTFPKFHSPKIKDAKQQLFRIIGAILLIMWITQLRFGAWASLFSMFSTR